MFKKLGLVGLASAAAVLLISTSPALKEGKSFFAKSENAEVEQAFIQFIAKYGRSYASKHELPERFKIFQKNYETIMAHNTRSDVSFKMGVNQFADRFEHEMPQSSVQVDEEAMTFHDSKKLLKASLQQAVTQNVDWRTSGKVSPVQDQGTCGACWAFSGTDCVSSAFAIEKGYSIANGDTSKTISIQHHVDCDTNNNGCNGGNQDRLYAYIKSSGHFQTQDYYYTNYIMMKGNCMAS